VKQKLSRFAIEAGAAALLIGGIYWHWREIRVVPIPLVQVQLRSVEAQLTEIVLINPARFDAPLPQEIVVSWIGDAAPAYAALSSYDSSGGGNTAVFRLHPGTPISTLHAGQPLAVGWIRLAGGDSNLQAHITGGQSASP
jgi:hypothetical protein